MTDQASLFMDEPPVWAQDPIGQRWWAFHRAHPEVGREFVRLAREWLNACPGQRVGAKAVVEVLRWNYAIGVTPTTESEPYKINNNYPALMSRWAMENFPDLRDVFEIRTRVSAA